MVAERRLGWWPGITLLMVTLAVVAVYYRQIFEGLVPAGYDVQTYFFPLRSYTREALLDGRIPLWTPEVFMGAPVLANPQAAVFYPLNLLLLPLDPAKALAATVVLHVWIGGVGMALFVRRVLGLNRGAAVVAALAFSLGGVMSAQTGHPNQLAAIAWIPFLLWAVDRTVGRAGDAGGWRIGRLGPVLGLAVVVALQVTAGHPQQVYIALLIVAGYAIFRLARLYRGGGWRSAGSGVGWLVAGLVLGMAISAVQLLPALFLSAQSIRAGGLPLYEAGSFSLRPGDLGPALLPAFTDAPRSQEFLAFVGFTGLWLAGVGLIGRRHRGLALTLLGAGALALLLAAGPELPFFRLAHRWLPGFDLFRVPARWLVVVNLALALLAGLGAERLEGGGGGDGWRRLPVIGFGVGLVVMLAVGLTSIIGGELPGRILIAWLVVGLATGVLVVAIALRPGRLLWLLAPLLAGELFFAVRTLELARPIPAEAFSGSGPVLAVVPAGSDGARALGLADPSYEVNDVDRTAYASEYLERIGEESFRQFLVALKYRDTLSPNLANAYGRPSPDGYDGGVLPLRDYVRFKSAFLAGAETAPDALMRNQFEEIPEGWVLDLMGVGYLLTDRKDDLEIEGVFVDMEEEIRLAGPGERVIRLSGPVAVEKVVVVGSSEGLGGVRLELLLDGGLVATITLPADGEFRLVEEVSLSFVDGLRVVAADGAKVAIGGVTLTDPGGGQHPMVLSDDPEMDLIWWTDVKVYRLRDPAPRAAVVSEFGLAAGPEEAVAMMQVGGGLDSRRAVVLEIPDGLEQSSVTVLGGIADWLRALAVLPPKGRFGMVDEEVRAELEAGSVSLDRGGGWWRLDSADGLVEIVDYEPERVVMKVLSSGPALLVLKDAIYPGWKVEIDGVEAPLLRANVLHRAVLAPAGEHMVEFTYDPPEVATGSVISLVAMVVFTALLATLALERWKRREAGE